MINLDENKLKKEFFDFLDRARTAFDFDLLR
jgi:hypothetical protein